MTGKRSFTGGPAVPAYPESPVKEAVKHLRLTADRYLKDRATLAEVREAISLFTEETEKALDAARGHR